MPKIFAIVSSLFAAATVALLLATVAALQPPPNALPPTSEEPIRVQILDRHGEPLNRTFDNAWNLYDQAPLHEIPELLRNAFLVAEDRRFDSHRGVDWLARLHAAVENVRARRVVRGASTITEQAVRMLHPRPRTLWARWLEGIEAGRLERRFSKTEILEFYLNQVPYARQRRGVVQAARDSFGRDLETLNPQEMLALAVLVRSPSRLDLHRSPTAVRGRLLDLAGRMHDRGLLDRRSLQAIGEGDLQLGEPQLAVEAPHFVHYVRRRLGEPTAGGRVSTFLDGGLQRAATAALDRQIELMAERGVTDGAALAVDHQRNQILAWANAGGYSPAIEASQIDAVSTLRQPGSTLKPFLYALALERGWTAATVLDDSPLARPVGRGLHEFQNYSRAFYGPLRLRDALGNSLNIPAVRAAEAVTPAAFLQLLRRLGFAGLERDADYYGEGLALGNGEVTLLELVGAYATLARGGFRQPLLIGADEVSTAAGEPIFSPEVASLIGDILSDPAARRLEFGSDGVLSLPVQTAVKTGTSNDYRDAWALGFSDRYTAGVWMGNLDRREMDGVSGAVGPALVLRAIFAELRRSGGGKPLYLSPKLTRQKICAQTGKLPTSHCPAVDEWFRHRYAPADTCSKHQHPDSPRVAQDPSRTDLANAEEDAVRLTQPTPGLHLAMDPRIPDELEAFAFEVAAPVVERIRWIVDGEPVANTGRGQRRYLWHLAKGRHEIRAEVWGAGATEPTPTATVAILVK